MADDIKFVIGVDDRDLIKAQKEQLKFQRNLITVEKAFRKGDISAKRYNSELAKQAKQLQTLGGSYNKANSEVRKYAYSLRQANDAQLDQAKAMAFAGKKINRMGVGLQQAGYQIGDFAVQIQGGTNAAVALGQQGSQLLGIFGPAGAIAGAGLAIATAFIAPLLKARDTVKEVKEELKELGGQLELLQSGAADAATLVLNTQIAEVQGKIFEMQNKTVDLSYADKDLKKQILDAVKRSKSAEDEKLKVLQLQLVELNLKKDAIRINKDLTGSEANEQQNLHDSEKRRNRERIAEQEAYEALVKKTRRTMGQVSAEATTLSQEVLDTTTRLGGSVEEAVKLQKALDSGKNEASQLSGVDINKAISPAVKSAMELARQLGISFRLAAAMSGAIVRGSDPEALDSRSERYDPAVARAARFKELQESGDLYKDFPKAKGGTSTGGGSKKSPAEELKEYLGNLKDQSELERKLVGLSGEKRNTEEAVIKARQKYDEVFTAAQEAELRGTLALIAADKERQRVFEEAEQQRQQLVSSIESTLEDGFMSMIDGTKSVKDAFRDMARDIIRELYRVLVVKKLVASISGFFGFADGGAFSGGSQIQAYADGGVVGGPTFFPMSGGKTGLMGEAGPEAIMPLKRGANGKLGVQAEGSSGGDINIVQNFSFAANGDDSVKKLIAQAAPQIANLTQKQIMDSRRRGGSMKAAFG